MCWCSHRTKLMVVLLVSFPYWPAAAKPKAGPETPLAIDKSRAAVLIMDYQLVIVSDACADRDAEVHRVLMTKVFPWQATVTTTQQFAKAVGR
jgi:hypothetical protein